MMIPLTILNATDSSDLYRFNNKLWLVSSEILRVVSVFRLHLIGLLHLLYHGYIYTHYTGHSENDKLNS